MLSNLIAGNEKAIIGGLSAGILTILSQLGVNGQMTTKEAVYAVATWFVVHVMIYVTTNSKDPTTPASKVVAPTNTPPNS